MKAIVTIPRLGDPRFKRWAKIVEKVDVTRANGYAFVGEFVRGKVEVEVGKHILVFGVRGSNKRNNPFVELHRVDPDGLSLVYQAGPLCEQWALDVRDDIARIVNESPEEVNPLAGFSDDEILAEARRRGLI